MIQTKKIFAFFLFVVFGMFLARAEVSAETDFDAVIAQVEELEQIAKEYVEETDGTDAKRLVMCYLISDRYQGGLWEKVAVRKNEDFETYVKEKDASLESLKQIEVLQVPAGYEVDFLHMAASIYIGDDAGGWIGDLTEFICELKQNGIESEEGAKERFFSEDGYFNPADFYADIDAANMTGAYKSSSFSETLRNYYTDEVTTEEDSLYRFTVEKFDADSRETMEQAVVYSYKSHWLIQELYNAFGIDEKADQRYIVLAANTFADYIYDRTGNRIEQNLHVNQKADQIEALQEAEGTSETMGNASDKVITEVTDTGNGTILSGIALILLIIILILLAWKRKK